MQDGWIKLHRKLLESDIFYNKPPEYLKIWIYILLKVNHTNGKQLKEGEGWFSWPREKPDLRGVTEYQWHNCLRLLKQAGQITTQKTTRGTFIRVINYSKYQHVEDTNTKQNTKQNTESKQNRYKTMSKECKNERNSTIRTTNIDIPDAPWNELTREQQNKALDVIVSLHFRKFPYAKSPLKKIYGKDGWVRCRIRVRDYFEGIFEKYPVLRPMRIIKAVKEAQKEEPWKYYPKERAMRESASQQRIIADRKPNEEDLEILKEAKKALEICSNEEKILYWLKKLPRTLHGNLAAHLSRVYPDGHSYDKAKIRYEREVANF